MVSFSLYTLYTLRNDKINIVSYISRVDYEFLFVHVDIRVNILTTYFLEELQHYIVPHLLKESRLTINNETHRTLYAPKKSFLTLSEQITSCSNIIRPYIYIIYPTLIGSVVNVRLIKIPTN
jgi:hypothetical protein